MYRVLIIKEQMNQVQDNIIQETGLIEYFCVSVLVENVILGEFFYFCNVLVKIICNLQNFRVGVYIQGLFICLYLD